MMLSYHRLYHPYYHSHESFEMNEPIYNKIGKGYNSTRQADPHLAGRFHHFLCPSKNGLYLDIGCGTGNYTIAVHEKGLNLVGIDPSNEMLQVAKNRNQEIRWIQGFAENIPLEDETFDGIMGCLTLHHWKDIEKGYKELYRVLKPGGKMVFFTSSPEQTAAYWLKHYFPVTMKASSEALPAIDMLMEMANSAGFTLVDTEKYFIKNDLKDGFLYSGKYTPEIYLDENIRKGSSGFSLLGNKDEVDQGLIQLANDIQNNKIGDIIKQHENDLGDYMFICFEKK